MAIASLFGVVALPIVLIGVLLPVALVVALQVWLCKRKNRWLGLILPGLSLLFSLAMLLRWRNTMRSPISELARRPLR